MANADLSIKVSADTTAAAAQVEKLSAELVDLGKDAQTAAAGMDKITPVTSKLQTNLAKMAVATTKADSALDKMNRSSNVAGQSLINLGRIAQDAPFGFIGIQNNLNPLLESFQRLKAETGSTGSALKALGSSLLGAGGIGLALSVASAAILFFQSGLISFGGESKKAAAAAKEFADSLDDARASGIASGLQLQAYADIAANTNNSLETRNEALEKANKIMGEHGEKLTLVNIATKGAREEIEKFTQATIQQALASKFADKAADLIIARAKAFKEFAKARDELNKVENTKEIVVSGATGGVSSGVSTLGKLISAQGRYNDKLKEYQSITQGLGEVTNELNKSQEESARLFGELGKKPPELKPERAKAAAKNIKVAIEKEFEAEQMILRPQLIEISSEQIRIDKEKADKAIYDALGKKPMKTKVQLQADIDFSNVIEQAKVFSYDVSQILSESISSFAEGIANAVNGTGSIGDVFGNVFKIIGEGLAGMGKAMIAYGTGIVVLKKAISNPYLAIAAGVGLVLLGKLMQNAIPKFADGVTNFGGGMAIVGERGPELVRLPKGSDVIPNGRVNEMAASGASVFIPAITLRGQDLVIAFNRASQTISRNG